MTGNALEGDPVPVAYVVFEDLRAGVPGLVLSLVALAVGLALLSWFLLGTVVDIRARREVRAARALLTAKIAEDAPPGEVLEVGIFLAERGQAQDAEDAFDYVEEYGDDEHAPLAALYLGALHLEGGDLTSARTAFQYAVDNGNPEQARRASAGLARIRSRES